MAHRRTFLGSVLGTAAAIAWSPQSTPAAGEASPEELFSVMPNSGESAVAYIYRTRQQFDEPAYLRMLGCANEFKEGDAIVGVAAPDEKTRAMARQLLASTTLREIDAHAPNQDELYRLIEGSVDVGERAALHALSLAEMRDKLLAADEAAIKKMAAGLSSDVIACLVKLMSNEELIRLGQSVFHPLPGTNLGARGYMGARVQPNSPTDHVDDIRWQVLSAWSYGVGDVLLGTNPVSSTPESVLAVEEALKDLIEAFGLQNVLPHCVLSHIDVQAEVEKLRPHSTALWFQSIAGSDAANKTFDVSIEKMKHYASMRKGKYGFYFETGQGADFTNGHARGYDMVIHESRKYGLARAMKSLVAEAQRSAGNKEEPWIHVNDVAGFIGPEVFRTREQLVRCCLEDIVMGKLHGLCIGLDICSTLHMSVSLDDLDWCIEQIMPACPAYLMALPTKIDPMLGYLTTGYHDHLRIRQQFGYKVNDAMWAFFQSLQVIDELGRPTEHFGDAAWVYLQYRRAQGDTRPDDVIRAQGQAELNAVRERGVFVSQGSGAKPWELPQALRESIQTIYDDAKLSIWAELPEDFSHSLPACVELSTRNKNREDYILHPVQGERLSEDAKQALLKLRREYSGQFNVQVVISDGLNALAISDAAQLQPFLARLRSLLLEAGLLPSPTIALIRAGRVRAGYETGEILFGDLPHCRGILHVIGERPGTGRRTFSCYITAAKGQTWGQTKAVDHDITKVVSGVALTALRPDAAAETTVALLRQLFAQEQNG